MITVLSANFGQVSAIQTECRCKLNYALNKHKIQKNEQKMIYSNPKEEISKSSEQYDLENLLLKSSKS